MTAARPAAPAPDGSATPALSALSALPALPALLSAPLPVPLPAPRRNVLLLITSAGVGGAEIHAISLLNGLDQEAFRLSLAYLKDEAELLARVDRRRLRGALLCCHAVRKLDWAALRRLARCIEAEQIDIVVCSNAYPLLYAWLARRLSRRRPRLVAVFHSTGLATLKERWQMCWYAPLLRLSDLLVYVCDNQRRYWQARWLAARRQVVIHNGVDTDYFSDRYSAAEVARWRHGYGWPAGAYVVGLCACMRPEKAHADLLAALAAARAAGLPVQCLLIGDGPLRGALEAQVLALGLAGQVGFTGQLADVRPAVAACDVLVIASHSVETFSIAALEAMALGKPLIMSDVGGASEQVTHGHNGYLYRHGDIAALAEAMRLLAAPARRHAMGQAARATVTTRFSLPRMLAAYARELAQLERRAAPDAPD